MNFSLLACLLILFLFKHALCDYGLQTIWMVHGKRRSGFRFVLPLLCHSTIHGATSFYVVLVLLKGILWKNVSLQTLFSLAVYVALIDTISHFVIDRSKALLERISNNKKFRLELTLLDQSAHCVVYLFIVYFLGN